MVRFALEQFHDKLRFGWYRFFRGYRPPKRERIDLGLDALGEGLLLDNFFLNYDSIAYLAQRMLFRAIARGHIERTPITEENYLDLCHWTTTYDERYSYRYEEGKVIFLFHPYGEEPAEGFKTAISLTATETWECDFDQLMGWLRYMLGWRKFWGKVLQSKLERKLDFYGVRNRDMREGFSLWSDKYGRLGRN